MAEQSEQRSNILKGHKTLFDGTLGRFKNNEYHIELKQGAMPHQVKPFAVPKAYKIAFRREITEVSRAIIPVFHLEVEIK